MLNQESNLDNFYFLFLGEDESTKSKQVFIENSGTINVSRSSLKPYYISLI